MINQCVTNKVKTLLKGGDSISINKKMIALIAVVVVIVGGYASYYTYASTYLIPKDVKVFKDELKSMEGAPIPEKNITEMETLANHIQKLPSLKVVPLSERKKMANEMRNDPYFTYMNSTIDEINENFTNNQIIASKYDILLKGDVANNIRDVYNVQIIDLVKNMTRTYQKMPNDIEKGDNNAYANDFRELAKYGRELNVIAVKDKTKLQNIINSLGG